MAEATWISSVRVGISSFAAREGSVFPPNDEGAAAFPEAGVIPAPVTAGLPRLCRLRRASSLRTISSYSVSWGVLPPEVMLPFVIVLTSRYRLHIHMWKDKAHR